jgi:hypothetical protein
VLASQAIFGILVSILLGSMMLVILPLIIKVCTASFGKCRVGGQFLCTSTDCSAWLQIVREYNSTLAPFIEGIPMPLVSRLHAAAEAHVRVVEASALGRDEGDDAAGDSAVGGGGGGEDTFDDDEDLDDAGDGGDAGLGGDFDWAAMVRKLGVDDAAAAAAADSESVVGTLAAEAAAATGPHSTPPGDAADARTSDFAARRRQRLAASERSSRRHAVRQPWGPFLRLSARFLVPFLGALGVLLALHLTTIAAVTRADGLLGAGLAAGLLTQEVRTVVPQTRSVVMKVRDGRTEREGGNANREERGKTRIFAAFVALV